MCFKSSSRKEHRGGDRDQGKASITEWTIYKFELEHKSLVGRVCVLLYLQGMEPGGPQMVVTMKR